MRLYTFEVNGEKRIGAESHGTLIDLASAYEALQANCAPDSDFLRAFPRTMLAFIRAGVPALNAAAEAVAHVRKRRATPVGLEVSYPLDAVKFCAPIDRPGKILCVGSGANRTIDYVKFSSAVIGPGESIFQPNSADGLRFNVRLAVVLGKILRNATESDAQSSIFGYTLLNDVFLGGAAPVEQMLAHNFDTFCPIGACIVTADELNDTTKFIAKSIRNGESLEIVERCVGEFRLPEFLSSLSHAMTLAPGDIVALPFSQTGLTVRAGDRLVVEVDPLGRLENDVRKAGV